MKFIFILLSMALFCGCNKSVPPQEQRAFIEKLIGGKNAYETVAAPDHVEAWLLTTYGSDPGFQEKNDRSGPIKLSSELVKTFSETVLNFNSYFHLDGPGKACVPDFGVRLQFTRGTNIVEIRLCFECDILEVTSNSQSPADFDPSHNVLVKAVQTIFPDDKIVKALELRKGR
jgi:hypothetical protein